MDASQSSNKDINTSMKKLTVDKKSINTSLNRTLRGNDTPLASNNDTEGKSIKSMFGLLDPQKIIEKGQ